MAKITLTDIASELPSTSALNDNFTSIETELQNRVLYRDNPTGEPNTMLNDLDMNGNNIVNLGDLDISGSLSIGALSATTLTLNGAQVTSDTALVTYSLAGASDTTLTSPALSEVLVFDGVEWINASSVAEFTITTLNSTDANITTVSSTTLAATDQTTTGQLRIGAPTVPASASDTGTAGEIAWDANYIYVCTATNTWKRVAIATW